MNGSYVRWSNEEVVIGYLLTKAPVNRVYQKAKSGRILHQWSRPDYASATIELNMVNQQLSGEDYVSREPSCLKAIVESRRAYMEELSKRIALRKVPQLAQVA